jgi:hypothetical protein
MSVLLVLASLAATPAPDSFAQRAWGRFSRYVYLRHSGETVEIATAAADPQTHVLSYTMRLTRTRFSQPDEVLWADSRTCAAMRPVLVAMQDVPMPRPSVPGLDKNDINIVLDGADYRLRVPGRFGAGGAQLEISSNVGTPLAAWVGRSLAALEPCWSENRPG